MQEATNSTIGAIRPCVNGTVEHEHLNTIFLVRLGNQLALVVTNKVDIMAYYRSSSVFDIKHGSA